MAARALAAIGALLAVLFLVLRQESRVQDGEAGSERGQRVFAAARSASGGVAGSSGNIRRQEAELALYRMLTAVVTGELLDQQRAEARQALLLLLESQRWGSAPNRALATSVVVQQIFDHAQRQGTSPTLDERQRAAISALAKELARQLLLLAVGLRAGADGIGVTLPGGYEALTWGELGGFEYREGASCPPGSSR